MKSITFKLTPTELFSNDEVTVKISEEVYSMLMKMCFLGESPKYIYDYLSDEKLEFLEEIKEKALNLFIDKDDTKEWGFDYSDSFIKDTGIQLKGYKDYDLPVIMRECVECGNFDLLFIVGEDLEVCKDCFEDNYCKCDICGEYWNEDAIEFHYKDDDTCICEYCFEEMEDEED